MNFGTNFEPKTSRPHPVDESGTQHIFQFPNGYGASVVRFKWSYGGHRSLWELAVIKFRGDDWDINYQTPITDDVIGYLSEDRVAELLNDIAALPA